MLALHLWMLKSPQTFGLENATEAFSYAFISVGVWWLVFLLPLLFFVTERHSSIEVASHPIRAAYEELKSTVQKISQYRNVMIFLSSYWLYVGGVFTVIFMAVNYGQRLGFEDSDLVMALLIANIVDSIRADTARQGERIVPPPTHPMGVARELVRRLYTAREGLILRAGKVEISIPCVPKIATTASHIKVASTGK